MNIFDIATKAISLLSEGVALIDRVSEAITDTKEALSTDDLAKLTEMLETARAKRVEADAALQKALDAVEGS